MAELPSGTVTFLFTDIEGSTARWEHQPEAMRAALARHDALVRAAIHEHHGHVVKTIGDAFHAVFVLAPDAVAAALDAQRRLEGATSWKGWSRSSRRVSSSRVTVPTASRASGCSRRSVSSRSSGWRRVMRRKRCGIDIWRTS